MSTEVEDEHVKIFKEKFSNKKPKVDNQPPRESNIIEICRENNTFEEVGTKLSKRDKFEWLKNAPVQVIIMLNICCNCNCNLKIN